MIPKQPHLAPLIKSDPGSDRFPPRLKTQTSNDLNALRSVSVHSTAHSIHRSNHKVLQTQSSNVPHHTPLQGSPPNVPTIRTEVHLIPASLSHEPTESQTPRFPPNRDQWYRPTEKPQHSQRRHIRADLPTLSAPVTQPAPSPGLLTQSEKPPHSSRLMGSGPTTNLVSSRSSPEPGVLASGRFVPIISGLSSNQL
uniref:Uncharacterized protein n=1 Tax=Knipowitschia caucasica TaxID=637954 RepID=A0AAV2K8E6_KNICA